MMMTAVLSVALLMASPCADLACADASHDLPKSPAKLVAPLQRHNNSDQRLAGFQASAGWHVAAQHPIHMVRFLHRLTHMAEGLTLQPSRQAGGIHFVVDWGGTEAQALA